MQSFLHPLLPVAPPTTRTQPPKVHHDGMFPTLIQWKNNSLELRTANTFLKYYVLFRLTKAQKPYQTVNLCNLRKLPAYVKKNWYLHSFTWNHYIAINKGSSKLCSRLVFLIILDSKNLFMCIKGACVRTYPGIVCTLKLCARVLFLLVCCSGAFSTKTCSLALNRSKQQSAGKTNSLFVALQLWRAVFAGGERKECSDMEL